MENEAIKSSEQTENIEQLKAKYESIPPMDMGPTNEAISKLRLDEIFDTFNENADSSLTQEDKQEIETLISQLTNGRSDKNNILLDISNFIKEFGNEITKEYLIKNIQERITNQQNLTENTTEHSRTENIRSLTTSLNTLLPANDSKPYKPLLDKLQTIDPNNPGPEFDEILAQLNNPQTLLSVSLDLQTQDQKNGTHNFETFKTAIINLDPSFKDKFPQTETQAMLALGTDNLQNTKIEDGELKQTTDDGFTTSATLDGTTRTVGRTDSNYTLKSDLDTSTAQREADKITNDLNETLKPIDKSLTTIKAMKTHLEEAKRQETPLETVKNELQALNPDLYIQLGLDFLNSPDEILNRLTTHETELTTKKAELQAQADKARKNLISNQKEKAQEKDEIRKEVLNFIHQIGFDTLPQAVTDQIIANINANPQKYDLQKPIDFENGSLGFDTDLGSRNISELEKQKFIELYNKILTGSREYPVRQTDGNITFHRSLEKARASIDAGFMFDMGEFASRSLGDFPTTKAMMNLEGEESKRK